MWLDTCAFAIQPVVLKELARNAAFRGRGLLARFLYAAPESWIGKRVIAPAPVTEATRDAYHAAVKMLAVADGDWALPLDSGALSDFDSWEAEIESMLADGGQLEQVRDWGSKLAGATLRLAAVLHCVEFGPDVDLTATSIASAIEIARCLIPHADAILGQMQSLEDVINADARYVLRWIERHERKEFTKRDAQQHGKVAQRAADTIKFRVEQLVAAKITGHALENDTAHWIAKLDEGLAGKLANLGLISRPVIREKSALGPFLDAYFARRAASKPATIINLGHTRRNLLAFFGDAKPLEELSVADARDFERYLKTTARENRYADAEGDDALSQATIRKRISNAKLFFNDAVERGLIDSNPFAKLKGANVSNAARQFFVTREMTEKLLEACPDAQWRLIVALARYQPVENVVRDQQRE